jgi:hypothetical protein
MAENSYAGYVKRPTPINWGEVASGVVSRMEDTEKKHEAFRTKYDAMAGELRKEVDKFVETSGLSPELDQKVSEATQMAKGLIFDMHNKLKRREISPSSMNNLQHSISSDWADFNTVVKNIDQGLSAAVEGYNEGVNGEGTMYAVKKYADLMDLKHQNIVFDVDDSGFASLYMQKVDDNGDPVDNGLTSIRTLKNPNNLIFRDVKVVETVADFQKRIKPGIPYIQQGNVTVVDPKGKPEYDAAAEGVVEDLTKDDKSVLSVLADFGGYEIYTEGDTPPSDKAVAMKVGANGELEPVITEELEKEAKQLVRDEINLQSPYKKLKKPTPKGNGGRGLTSDEPKLVYQYATGLSQGDSSVISSLIQSDDDIVDIEITQKGPRKGVTIINKEGKRIFTPYKYSGGEIDHDATGADLAKYFSNKSDLTSQQAEYNQGRKDFGGAVAPGGTTTKKVKPEIVDIKTQYKNPKNNKDISAVKAIANAPESLAKDVFEDLGIPGVTIVSSNYGDDTFKIKVEGQEFTIKKSKRSDTAPHNIIRAGGASDKDVMDDIQKVIDWYWSKLAMEQPQEQPMDLTQTGAKYNVA